MSVLSFQNLNNILDCQLNGETLKSIEPVQASHYLVCIKHWSNIRRAHVITRHKICRPHHISIVIYRSKNNYCILWCQLAYNNNNSYSVAMVWNIFKCTLSPLLLVAHRRRVYVSHCCDNYCKWINHSKQTRWALHALL